MHPQKELSGILFNNDRKRNEKSPDYKGSATIQGNEYWMSGWIKEGKSSNFLSLSFQAKESQEPDNRTEDMPF